MQIKFKKLYHAASAPRVCIMLILLCGMVSGCKSTMTLEDKALRIHVVDACFTVQEQSPDDSSERIDKYLQKYEDSGELSCREVYTLKESLKRAKEAR